MIGHQRILKGNKKNFVFDENDSFFFLLWFQHASLRIRWSLFSTINKTKKLIQFIEMERKPLSSEQKHIRNLTSTLTEKSFKFYELKKAERGSYCSNYEKLQSKRTLFIDFLS
ncbi:hypothetical protein KFK09_027226 [Dendrobium nobile]|uniref:Uncharacterized protein n=1 Tax=Dendrobium nobile TaxID=94219 RepID=A0A8T3A9V3_DENNO|nr:hypothetical protein KFK09_027226 [Dendrobium nobile]